MRRERSCARMRECHVKFFFFFFEQLGWCPPGSWCPTQTAYSAYRERRYCRSDRPGFDPAFCQTFFSPFSNLFIFNFLIISLIFIENKCLYDAIQDLKREKKTVRQKAGSNLGRSLQKDNDMRFTIYATGADVSADSAVLLLVLPVHFD